MSNQDGTSSEIWQFSVARLKRRQDILKARGPAGCRPWGVEVMRIFEKVGNLGKKQTNKILLLMCFVQETVPGSAKSSRHMTTKSSCVTNYPSSGKV